MIVVMGNGQKEDVLKIGNFKGIAFNKNNNKQGIITLSNMVYLPNGKYNIISLTKIMETGWKIVGNTNGIKLVKDNKNFIFDIKIKTSTGTLYAVKIDNMEEVLATVNDEENTVKTIDINEAHTILGHLSEKTTKEISRHLEWKLTGTKQRCEHCVIGRGCQSNVNKNSNHISSNNVGERYTFQMANTTSSV